MSEVQSTPPSFEEIGTSLSADAEESHSHEFLPDAEISHSLEIPPEDTWIQITKRDRPLSNANCIAVMDHAHTVLEKRICEASDEYNFRECLTIFDKTLGRFQNSEISLGKRIASGNFADIYQMESFLPLKQEIKPCTKVQMEGAELIKKRFKPNELVVKVLRGNLLLNPSLYATAAADFITEGTLLASLSHPHIVSLRARSVVSIEGFASGKRDSVFLVLERLHGDLTHRLRQWKDRTSQNRFVTNGIAGRRDCKTTILRERVKALAELADAMAFLHERNIIHRDLKLSNVGVDARGRMKLLDFGLAKILPRPKDENELFRLTGNTGSVR
jgi:serine/threonine protein kinase